MPCWARPDRAVLRRISVFAAPFTAAAAEAMLAGWPPAGGDAVPAALARLAEQSLLVAVADMSETRYRALETIRQYGAAQLATGRRSRSGFGPALGLVPGRRRQPRRLVPRDDRAWRWAFDQVADELRAALRWAAAHAERRPEAYRLAIALAELCFARGFPGESQRRYEQAAGLAPDASRAATALRCAAGAAKSRHFGDDALRLLQEAADAAVRAGERPARPRTWPRRPSMLGRAVGLMATAPPDGLADELLARGRALAGGNVAAQARLLTAEAYTGDDTDPVTAELAERAITLARRAGDPLAESAALDDLTAVQVARGELRGALASTLRRLEILGPLPVTARSGLEHSDSLFMATECATAVGDLRAARQLAERVRDLPFHREEGHLATARLIVVATLAGDWDEALALAGQFREGWEQAGRPRAGNLTRSAYAAATVHGLRGDDDARAAWLDIVDALATPGPAALHHALQRVLRCPAAAAPGPGRGGDEPAARAAGAVPRLGQRDVAAVVRGAVGRGGRGHRAPGRRRPDPPRPAGHVGQPGRRGHRGPGRGAGLRPGQTWSRRPRPWRPPGAGISGPGRSSPSAGPNGPGGRPRWPPWARPSWPGLQDEVERGLGGPAHPAEARLGQHGAQPALARLRAEPEPDLLVL